MTTAQQRTASPPSPVIIAAAPFDDPDADIILRSADDVHFHVYKAFLSLASPVFKDMFRLPQPKSNPTDEGGRPIIPVTEDCRTVDMLLGFCYPAMDTTLQSFDDITAMITTMNKYDMEIGLERVRKQLLLPPFIEEPLRVFAIAYRFKLRHEAISAMKESVRHPLRVPSYPELEYIPSSVYHLYFTYRVLCGEKIANLVEWKPYGTLWHYVTNDHCRGCCRTYESNDSWLAEYARGLAVALAARPCVQTIAATDPELYRSAITKSRQCSNCSRSACEGIPKFVQKTLVPEIEKTLSQVPLDLDI